MGFNNLGRELYEQTLNELGQVIGKKKKDVVAILNKSSNFTESIRARALRSGKLQPYMRLNQAVNYVSDFRDITHYYVSDLTGDSKRTYADINPFSIGDCFTIESTMDAATVIGRFTKFADDDLVIFDKHKVIGMLDIFAKVNTQYTKGVALPITTPITTVYLVDDFKSIFLQWYAEQKLTLNNRHGSVKFKFKDFDEPVGITCISADDFNNSLAYEFAVWMLMCAEDIVTARDRISAVRKSSKSSSSRKPMSVHISIGDKLVPLSLYAYACDSISKCFSKGGHHASPISHDRRGHYRKSRGRGDYDYINGEFVYVGNKQGKYSYVKPTRVHGKSDHVLVYKV